MNLYRLAGFLSLCLIYFTISCTRHILLIKEGDTATQNLKLLQKKDGTSGDVIKAREGDRVLWRIKTKTVRAIAKIDDKPDKEQPKFLSEHKPRKKFLSKTWATTVNRVVKDEFKGKDHVDEYYFIKWKPRGSDSTKTYDPLIQIYPK